MKTSYKKEITCLEDVMLRISFVADSDWIMDYKDEETLENIIQILKGKKKCIQ